MGTGCEGEQSPSGSAVCGVHTRPDPWLDHSGGWERAVLRSLIRAQGVEAAAGCPHTGVSSLVFTVPPLPPSQSPDLLRAIWGTPRFHQWDQAPRQDEDRENPTGRSGEERSGDGESMKAGSPNPFYS